jgi:hypothetical protein
MWCCVRCGQRVVPADAAWLELILRSEGAQSTLRLCPDCQRALQLDGPGWVFRAARWLANGMQRWGGGWPDGGPPRRGSV